MAGLRALLALAAAVCAGAAQADSHSILKAGEGRAEVEAQCDACHSLRLVAQQRLPRTIWSDILDDMVGEHGMTEPGGAERQRILDYLERVYGVPRPPDPAQ